MAQQLAAGRCVLLSCCILVIWKRFQSTASSAAIFTSCPPSASGSPAATLTTTRYVQQSQRESGVLISPACLQRLDSPMRSNFTTMDDGLLMRAMLCRRTCGTPALTSWSRVALPCPVYSSSNIILLSTRLLLSVTRAFTPNVI
jgi:hypothetical protein